jgi:hypothetical protein
LFHEESFHIFITSDHHETEEKTERGTRSECRKEKRRLTEVPPVRSNYSLILILNIFDLKLTRSRSHSDDGWLHVEEVALVVVLSELSSRRQRHDQIPLALLMPILDEFWKMTSNKKTIQDRMTEREIHLEEDWKGEEDGLIDV